MLMQIHLRQLNASQLLLTKYEKLPLQMCIVLEEKKYYHFLENNP
ncbi:Uncharacterised protein [Citrobacter braakii]|nr:Uncharacterised protein [Citrobacter braakii]